MVYIIVSNIGLAIMMIYIYFRYSSFRISSSKEIKELRSKNDSQNVELRNFDAKLLSSIKNYQDRIEVLLIEVGKVRQEKEKESELRMEIEKKYEILAQKNNDYQSVHAEITNAIMNIVNDTHETAKNLGKDLYEKISTTYKQDFLENKKLISNINQNVADFVTKFNASQSNFQKKKEEFDLSEFVQAGNSELTRGAVSDAIDLIKSKGLVANKDFYTEQNFDKDKSRFLLSEIAIIKDNNLHLLDFKATNYLLEYFTNKENNEEIANENFVNKFRKYLLLLSSNKYYDIINSLFGSIGLAYNSCKISIVVPSRIEMGIIKEMDFFEMARQFKIDILTMNDLENYYNKH